MELSSGYESTHVGEQCDATGLCGTLKYQLQSSIHYVAWHYIYFIYPIGKQELHSILNLTCTNYIIKTKPKKYSYKSKLVYGGRSDIKQSEEYEGSDCKFLDLHFIIANCKINNKKEFSRYLHLSCFVTQ